MEQKNQKILEMLKAGKTYTEIQTELNVSPSSVAQVVREYANEIDAARASLKKIESTLPQSHPQNPGNLDSATVIRLKELDNELVLSLKQLENEENAQQRAFDMEKYQSAEENQRLRKLFEETTSKLNEKITNLQQEFEYLSDQQWKANKESEDEFEDDPEAEDYQDEEPVSSDPEFGDVIRKFISELLQKDGVKQEEEEVNAMLNEIKKIKRRLKKMCKEDDNDYKDFEDWDILIAFEKYLKEKLDEFGFLTWRVEFIIESKYKQYLEKFIAGNDE